MAGDIEFRSGVRHAGETGICAVDPDKECGIHAFKVQVIHHPGDLVQVQALDIQRTGVLVRHKGRIIGDGVADIGILMRIVAVGLPDRRHRHGHKFGFLQQRVFFQPLNALIKMKVPVAGKRRHAVGIQPGLNALRPVGKVGNDIRTVGLRALVKELRIFQISFKIHLLCLPVIQWFHPMSLCHGNNVKSMQQCLPGM